MDTDQPKKTHFKAAANYLVSPTGQMLSDNILNHGDVSYYDNVSIGKTLDDDSVAKNFKKLNVAKNSVEKSNRFLDSCLSPRNSQFSRKSGGFALGNV